MESNILKKVVFLSDVTRKIKNRAQAIELCFRMGKNILFTSAGYKLPNYPCYGSEFVFDFGGGLKKVLYTYFPLLFKMLALSGAAEEDLPSYTLIEDLSKDNLLKYCLEDKELKMYFPDCSNVGCIDRKFICSVSLHY